VEGGIEECIEICQALNPLGKCEWLMYFNSPAKGERLYIPPYLNCEAFATDDGSFDQYLNTCDKHGQPTRRLDGSCTVNATNPSTGECKASICPSGCSSCDETDECYRKYHETECSMLTSPIEVQQIPAFEFCLEFCTILSEGATYATWSKIDHTCRCYSSGERLCRRQVVRSGFYQDDINQCISETSPTVPSPTEPSSTEGILVIGGTSSSRSVEFWSPSHPEQGSCVLGDYPREMVEGPTANFIAEHLVTCYNFTCDIFRDGTWQHLQDTLQQRQQDTSAASDEAVLLLGGHGGEYSTEWIPVDGSSAHPGAVMVGHGVGHCTIQVSGDVIVMSGGYNTEGYVTEYQLSNGLATPLAPLHQSRVGHACGVYQDAGGHQVILVTGGYSNFDLSSTEVATYTTDIQLEWREVNGGQLPSPRAFLRATIVENTIYLTGGGQNLDEILSWDPTTESWNRAGTLAVGRQDHAAVAIPSSIIALNCKN